MNFYGINLISALVILVQIVSAVVLIVLVLLQNGKGADMGSAFKGGAGGSASLFGAAGAANFLSRSTKWAAVVFFVATAGLAYIGSMPENAAAPLGVLEGVVPSGVTPSQAPTESLIPPADLPSSATPASGSTQGQ